MNLFGFEPIGNISWTAKLRLTILKSNFAPSAEIFYSLPKNCKNNKRIKN